MADTDSTLNAARTCATCATSIDHLFKLRRYCDEHTPRSSTKGKKPCPKCGEPAWSKTRECRACTKSRAVGCPDCGKPAKSRRRCLPCRMELEAEQPCAVCDRPRKLLAKRMCPTCYTAAYRAEHGRNDAPKKMHSLTCEFCSAPFENNDRHTRFCTAACAARKSAGWSTSKAVERRAIPRTWAGGATRGTATFTSGPCGYCGDYFTAKGRARYCSPKCGANAAWKRKYDRRGEFMVTTRTRIAIYERDNHTCQICLEPVDMTLPTNDRMGHTLDHIIPQSHQLVPDHSPSNLRMAHRLCNSIRGDRVA